MKNLNKISIVLVIVATSIMGKAQQAPMFTHYMYNTLAVNPAYAGSRDALTLTGLHRSQWVGFGGAPTTQTLTLHGPLKNEHIGLGASILNDKIGVVNNTSAFFDFSYIMKMSEKSKLALGLSAGANMMQARYSTVEINTQSDPVFQNDINNKLTPNFGFGAYYYREQFYAGLSTPNILENTYTSVKLENGTTLSAKEQRHYFLIIGALFNLGENLAFKPTGLLKVTTDAPLEADFTASFVLMKRLLLGAMYRTGDSFGGLVGVDITKQFHIGYSYDWSFGIKTPAYNQGSHEIVMRYDFLLFDKKQVHSPRNF
jgi:type IX secretion system PorP/SprF family membrane protein